MMAVAQKISRYCFVKNLDGIFTFKERTENGTLPLKPIGRLELLPTDSAGSKTM